VHARTAVVWRRPRSTPRWRRRHPMDPRVLISSPSLPNIFTAQCLYRQPWPLLLGPRVIKAHRSACKCSTAVEAEQQGIVGIFYFDVCTVAAAASFSTVGGWESETTWPIRQCQAPATPWSLRRVCGGK
jgi:hypothetical protein